MNTMRKLVAVCLAVMACAGLAAPAKMPSGWVAASYLGRNGQAVAAELQGQRTDEYEFTVGEATFRVEQASGNICWIREDLGGWKTMDEVIARIKGRTGRVPPPPLMEKPGVYANWHMDAVMVQANGLEPGQKETARSGQATYKSITYNHRPKMKRNF